MTRYDHWFWNSKFMMWVVRKVGKLNSYLWNMQYGRVGAKKN